MTKLFALTRRGRTASTRILVLALLVTFAAQARADEPYARSRDYDLQHSKIALRFDLDQKKIFGDVTHSLAILRDGTSKVAFDSVGLKIQGVTVNKEAATFETTANKLIVALPAASHSGTKFEIEIRYEGKPSKGIYFILPDKDYPNRAKQIWTQGESEDTRYYLPTYDYPNDRLTTETILTVPASFITISNGKLVSVKDAGNGLKTWTWKESQPSSTYLITVVTGDFDVVKSSWRNIPVDYYAPKGRGDRLTPNYSRTPLMIDLFSKKLGVDYPWEKYSQAMVDDFVAGGMENSSATTNESSSLKDPRLVPEYVTDEDPLISHELAHQWFGDLVTCKDWGDIWLNEGFATFFEAVWTGSHYPKENAEYDHWEAVRDWFAQSNLYPHPIVRFDFDDSSEFDQNVYAKGGLVLEMLRHQLGEDQLFLGLRRYLEVNRGKNVVTADLAKAIEEATHTNVDQFFQQWVYHAGAPRFDLSYTYDDAKHQIALTVKQTQKIEGAVGLFRVPVGVEITTPSGSKTYPITVAKDTETFSLPADAAPKLVLFDKGGYILKSADFHKEKSEWLFQLKNASELSDRADAVVALGKIKNDEEVVTAIGTALKTDATWGVRVVAADTLGKVGTASASKQLVESLTTNDVPWVRNHIVAALGNFKDDPAVPAKLEAIARDDKSYRARANALSGIARLKAPNALPILQAAITAESPDSILRNAALRALGSLGDDKAAALAREWSLPGKDMDSREGAIASLGRLDRDNKDITRLLESYLVEPHFPVRFAAIFALGNRGDASAIPALETLLKSNDLSIEMTPMIRQQIAKLKKGKPAKGGPGPDAENDDDEKDEAAGDAATVTQRLDRLEKLVQEMNERLKTIDARLAPKK
jgi:aminopeptidase N